MSNEVALPNSELTMTTIVPTGSDQGAVTFEFEIIELYEKFELTLPYSRVEDLDAAVKQAALLLANIGQALTAKAMALAMK